jgi:hypothetical protein
MLKFSQGSHVSQNWEHGKVLALIKAKRDEHVAPLNRVDP